MGNCVEICNNRPNSEKFLSINRLNENVEYPSSSLYSPNFNYEKSTYPLSNSLISNKLLNINNKSCTIGKNSKFKIDLIKCDKFDFEKSMEDQNSSSINEYITANTIGKNEEKRFSFDEVKNESKKKYQFQGPIYTHLIQRTKKRNKVN